ncbi:MAG TPA: hypothetical protein DDZ80_25330 [Cyanobacteria bacterium UBA8803]|nr:hypothetical protein [Cyanobacteria bacterium UBA8803]
MDAVQQQIVALSHKVDTLYQIIDQLSHQIAEALSDIKEILRPEASYSSLDANIRPKGSQSHPLLDLVMEHKDILTDVNSDSINSPQNSENVLSAEIQVQRLTAQLTAAYNRIAALEEQLLVRRIHL